MMGTFEHLELTLGSMGQQYTTIDGQRYVTFLNLTDPRLGGLKSGITVEFSSTPGPTKLCSSPELVINLPSATILGVAA
jgi:hypothetical protein